jgi:hypothetical protein
MRVNEARPQAPAQRPPCPIPPWPSPAAPGVQFEAGPGAKFSLRLTPLLPMHPSIDLSTLFLKRQAESRSLSAENFRGEKGAGGMATQETSLTPNSPRASRLGPGQGPGHHMWIPGTATRTSIPSAINVNPKGGLNSFFAMPFRRHAVSR